MNKDTGIDFLDAAAWEKAGREPTDPVSGDISTDPEYNTPTRVATRLRAMVGNLNKEILVARKLGLTVVLDVYEDYGDEKFTVNITLVAPDDGVRVDGGREPEPGSSG